MPKAAMTDDFAWGPENDDEKVVNYVDEDGNEISDPTQWPEQQFDEDIDNDMSKSQISLRPTSRKTHTTYVSADTPNEERRRMIVRVTLLAVVVIPSTVYLLPQSESFLLLAVMAFTFATNFAITIMSSNLEEKATSLELKTDTLLDELSSAASTLRNFQSSLEQIDLEQLKENVENARSDIEPLMERISNPSLNRIVYNVEQLIDYVEDVDLDKIDNLLQHYKKGNDIQPIVKISADQQWDILDEFPEEQTIDATNDEFFPIEEVMVSEEDDMFFP